jgi:hypothetical protein
VAFVIASDRLRRLHGIIEFRPEPSDTGVLQVVNVPLSRGEGSIQGRVTNVSGAPLAGSSILVYDAFKGAPVFSRFPGVSSGKDGAFTIEALPAGDYRICCMVSGFSRIMREVSVKDGDPSKVDIVLDSAGTARMTGKVDFTVWGKIKYFEMVKLRADRLERKITRREFGVYLIPKGSADPQPHCPWAVVSLEDKTTVYSATGIRPGTYLVRFAQIEDLGGPATSPTDSMEGYVPMPEKWVVSKRNGLPERLHLKRTGRLFSISSGTCRQRRWRRQRAVCPR